MRHEQLRVRTTIGVVLGALVSTCRHGPADVPTRVVPITVANSSRGAEGQDDLRALAEAAPPGWQSATRDLSESSDAGIGPVIVLEFTDRERLCEIHYGAGGATVRTEPAVLRLLVYR